MYELLRIGSGSLKQRHRLVCTHDGGLVPTNLTTKELGKSMIGNDSQEKSAFGGAGKQNGYGCRVDGMRRGSPRVDAK